MRDFNTDYNYNIQYIRENIESIEQILLNNIPAATSIDISKPQDDMNGIDIFVIRKNDMPKLRIDIKVRAIDPLEQYDSDDVALETYSNMALGKVGWSRDELKHTDYILWFFTPTGRSILMPFPMLCKVFQEFHVEWKNRFRVAHQHNKFYISECVFVPVKVIWETIQTVREERIAAFI
jgi:hypothetical protein